MLLNIASFETAPSYISATIQKMFTCFPASRTRFSNCWVRWFNDFSCTVYVYSNSCFETNLQFLEQGNVCCRDTRTYNVYGAICIWQCSGHYFLLLSDSLKGHAAFLIHCVTSRNGLDCTKLWQLQKIISMVFQFDMFCCCSFFPVFDFHCEDLCCIST
jgi:hypothetical protein